MTTLTTRFTQDDSGQWWYAFADGRRTRAWLAVCGECGREFPAWRAQRFCSVACRSAAREVLHEAKQCVQCGTEFKPTERTQRFCSHTCAATMHHARQAVTTSDGALLNNIGDHHYSLDERGQWWYRPGPIGKKDYPRTRAFIKTCEVCHASFLTNVFHQKQQGTCSKTCGQVLFNRNNPGAHAGSNSGMWKGGRRVLDDGYVVILKPDHPSLKNSLRRYVFEHRLVMEQYLDRLLEPNERVHHKNGIRDDNRIENLELCEISTHVPGQRATEQQHCPTCTCYQHPEKPAS